VDRKTQLALDQGYNIIVKYKQDLEKEFNWVKKHYSYKNVYELYDDYKPKYNYICNNCQSVFYRDKKVKTNTKFCSRSCAANGNQKLRHL